MKNEKRTRLKHALQALALYADEQLRLFPSHVCKADELALDFDNWCGCILQDREGLSEAQRAILKSLNSRLDEMSGAANRHLWTDEALRNRDEWEQVRKEAKSALVAFGWDLETPPSRESEFVRG